MKLSPMTSTANTVGTMPPDMAGNPSAISKVRSLKMNVNRTPGLVPEEIETPVEASETPVEENKEIKETEEATQPLSPQFAALAKQRRALQQEKQDFEKMKAEFEAQKSTSGGIEAERLKSDPIGVLFEQGHTFDTLADAINAYTSGGKSEVNELKAKIKALEEGVDKKLSDRDVKAEEQALDQMIVEAKNLASQGDEFELIKHEDAFPQVRQLIHDTYRKDGTVLDVREAMTKIETWLYNDTLKKANLNKVKSQLVPSTPQPEPVQQQRQMRTLTNRDSATVPMDRRARALAAARGTLKK